MFTILVTGDRDWTNEGMIREALQLHDIVHGQVRVIHGDCRGADEIAGRIAKELGYDVVPYPADWKQYGKAAGPIRNQRMVDTSPNVVFAFHPNLDRSKGTKDCIYRARKAGLPVFRYGKGGRKSE